MWGSLHNAFPSYRLRKKHKMSVLEKTIQILKKGEEGSQTTREEKSREEMRRCRSPRRTRMHLCLTEPASSSWRGLGWKKEGWAQLAISGFCSIPQISPLPCRLEQDMSQLLGTRKLLFHFKEDKGQERKEKNDWEASCCGAQQGHVFPQSTQKNET